MSLTDDQKEIHVVGPSYFAVLNIAPYEISSILKLDDVKVTTFEEAYKEFYPFDFSTPKKYRSKLLISSSIEGWVFIYSECGIYQYCKKIVDKFLSSASKINYYYGDSCVDCYEWIITENKEIIREFKYELGEISVNIGECITLLEKKFINEIQRDNGEFVFGEDVLTSIVTETCPLRKTHFNETDQFFIGFINESEYLS
jgi:hypothetical protein